MRNLEHCILVRLMGETGETSKCDDLGSSCIGETDEAINVRILEPYILVRLVRLSKCEDPGTSYIGESDDTINMRIQEPHISVRVMIP